MTAPTSPRHLTLWERAILLTIAIAPFYGGLAVVLAVLMGLVALGALVIHPRRRPAPKHLILSGFLIAYYVYFVLHGWIIGGALGPALDAMSGNAPLIAAAILCYYLGTQKMGLDAKHLGDWATVGTLATVAAALVLWALYRADGGATLGFLDAADLTGRLRLFSRNALIFGTMFIVLAFLSLAGFARKTTLGKALSSSALVLGLGVVALWTEARGATLAALVMMLFVLWYLRPPAVALAGIAAALAVTLGGAALLSDEIASHLTTAAARVSAAFSTAFDAPANADSSVAQRLTMYSLGWHAAMDAPLWGYGYAARFDAILPYMQPEDTFRYRHLHNVYLNHWVAGGLPGLVLALLYIAAPLISQRGLGAEGRDARYVGYITAAAMALVGMTTSLLGHHLQATFFSILMVAHLLLVRASGETSAAGTKP